MKSNRAKEMIEVMQEDYPDIFDEDIANELIAQYLRIVHIAEQDADGRVIEILKKVFKEKPSTKEDFIDRFKELLDGGQSGE